MFVSTVVVALEIFVCALASSDQSPHQHPDDGCDTYNKVLRLAILQLLLFGIVFSLFIFAVAHKCLA